MLMTEISYSHVLGPEWAVNRFYEYKRVTIYLLERVKKKKNIRKKLGVIHNNNRSMDEHLGHLIEVPPRKASTQ